MSDLRPKICLLGASIVEKSFSTEHCGWGAGLADWYGRSADVVNRGYSGYNSRFILQILPSIFELDESIIITVICIGANDSSDGWQEVSLDEYEANMKKIVDFLHTRVNPAMNIILITPPTVDVTKWPDRTVERTKLYAQRLLDLGIRYRATSSAQQQPPDCHSDYGEVGQVLTLSLWKKSDLPSQALKRGLSFTDLPMSEAIELEDLYDGLHPGITGNTKILNGLKSLLIQTLPSLVPSEAFEEYHEDTDGLPEHFPHFSDLVSKTDSEVKKLFSEWKWS